MPAYWNVLRAEFFTFATFNTGGSPLFFIHAVIGFFYINKLVIYEGLVVSVEVLGDVNACRTWHTVATACAANLCTVTVAVSYFCYNLQLL